jgi:hypothetical protein
MVDRIARAALGVLVATALATLPASAPRAAFEGAQIGHKVLLLSLAARAAKKRQAEDYSLRHQVEDADLGVEPAADRSSQASQMRIFGMDAPLDDPRERAGES